jgi:hypothetical protein
MEFPMRFFAIALFAGFVATLATPAGAADATIEISQAWARATAAGAKVGGAYVTIVNHGTADDRLTGAASPIAAKVTLHTTQEENGVMKMRPLAEVPVKAGATVTFQPGGMHIMLVDLTRPLKVGETFPLTLSFDKAGSVPATVTVVKAGASAGGTAKMPDMPGMDMSGMKMPGDK